MYKSGNEVDKKFKQAKYVYNQILKFKDRIFVKGGIDEEPGSYPLLTHISSFVAHSRAVFQYAQKEAKQSGHLSLHNNYVAKSNIIKFFKVICYSDIHEYTINTYYTVEGNSPIEPYDPKTHTAIGKPFSLYIEPLSDLDSPKDKNKDVKITITLGKRIRADNSLIKQLEDEGEIKLAKATRKGKEIFEEQECDGEKDIFKLCEAYLKEIEKFINFGRHNGFIS